jgi:hypothetical protein
MKNRVTCLPIVLLAMFVLATAMSTFAQSPTDAAQPSVRAIDPAEAAARTAAGKPLVDVEAMERANLAPAVVNSQTAVACNTCFTCGGDWPIFAGAVHAVNTGSATFERGPGCSGALTAANDNNPFLCCR